MTVRKRRVAGQPIKCVGEFLAGASGEKVELKAPSPALDLPGSHDDFFLANVARFAVLAPVELLERRTRLFIRRRAAQRSGPVRDHAPVVVVARFAFPFVQFGPADALAGEVTHRFERGEPERAAHVHQHPIDIEDQNFSGGALFRKGHANIGAERAERGNQRSGMHGELCSGDVRIPNSKVQGLELLRGRLRSGRGVIRRGLLHIFLLVLQALQLIARVGKNLRTLFE